MTFNSLQFLIFLPIVILVYFLLPHKVRWVWLLIASYYAYMSWNVWLVFLILGTTIVSYVAGLLIARTERKGIKKLWLALTLIVCLGTLIFFKYFNFLLGSVIDFLNLFALDIESVALDIILPVGISFYTFQTLSYVIDVYRGMAPEKHFGYYALFVSYFPQLVAGPIERPENLIPQLREKHSPNREDLEAGFRIMAVGFFRKCVVADFLGKFVDSVFSDMASANSLAVIAAGALFAVQLYCDFAGYSEIAMGSARMMGIKLMRNFDRPYSATSMRDFIRRWHISLNTWFRDYLYIPLGGSRKGKARQILNVFIVYALCGLWHGANWTYMCWGLFVAVIMTIEIFLRKRYHAMCDKLKIDNNGVIVVLIRRAIVFMLCIIGALMFRAQSIAQIGEIFAKLFTDIGFGAAYLDSALGALSMNISDLLRLALVLVCMLKLYDMAEFGQSSAYAAQPAPAKSAAEPAPYAAQPLPSSELISSPDAAAAGERSLYARRAISLGCSVLAIALAWFILISSSGTSAFVYFQF